MHPSIGATRPSQAGAHHHQGPIAKKPWHRKFLLCCLAGSNKAEDVADPFENTAAPTRPSARHTGLTTSSGAQAVPPMLYSQSTTHIDANTMSGASRPTAPTLESSAAKAVRPAGTAVPMSADPSTAVSSEFALPRAVGPARNLLDDVVTDPASVIYETSSGTASGRVARQDLNLGSPLITPSSSSTALAAAAARSQGDIRSSDDEVLRSDNVAVSNEGLAAGAAAAGSDVTRSKADQRAVAAPFVNSSMLEPRAQRHQQQQGDKSPSSFLRQKQPLEQQVTAELLALQMQEYRAQHSAEQQQQRRSLELDQQKRRLMEEQQQQSVAGSNRTHGTITSPPLTVSIAAPSEEPQQQQQQQFSDSSSPWNVVPMTTGLKPPLSPLRIPSSQNNLLLLISNSDNDSIDTPTSPRMSVVGVSNSVINNLLSEEGIPLVPTEPGLAESIMDPLPETLEVTPGTPKRVRSFSAVGGTSGKRVLSPTTPRHSYSGTCSYFAPPAAAQGGTSGETAAGSDTRRKSLSGVTATPLRVGPAVRNSIGDRQIMGGTGSEYYAGTRGGIRSDSNVIAGSYAGPGYVLRSGAAAGSRKAAVDHVESWDNVGSSKLRTGRSSSSSRPNQSSSFIEALTPRATGAAAAVGRKSLSFTYRIHAPAGSSSSLRYPDSSSTPTAAAKSANMSAANIAASASVEASPPDDPNPSYNSNAMFTVTEPSLAKINNRSEDDSYLESSFTGEFGGHSSSGPVVTSDGGFATGNMVGSGALFSRSGFAASGKGSKGLGGDDHIGVLDVSRKSVVDGQVVVAAPKRQKAVF